jgi:hypothetical protein
MADHGLERSGVDESIKVGKIAHVIVDLSAQSAFHRAELIEERVQVLRFIA